MNGVIKNTTCFKEHKEARKVCQNTGCRHWMSCKRYMNCSIIAAESGSRTLQEIGDLHDLTRMRICQIEKAAIKKIKEKLLKSNS